MGCGSTTVFTALFPFSLLFCTLACVSSLDFTVANTFQRISSLRRIHFPAQQGACRCSFSRRCKVARPKASATAEAKAAAANRIICIWRHARGAFKTRHPSSISRFTRSERFEIICARKFVTNNAGGQLPFEEMDDDEFIEWKIAPGCNSFMLGFRFKPYIYSNSRVSHSSYCHCGNNLNFGSKILKVKKTWKKKCENHES